jgi:hypothetical protein
VVLRVRTEIDAVARESLDRTRAALEAFAVGALGHAPALHGTVLPRALPPLTTEISGGL